MTGKICFAADMARLSDEASKSSQQCQQIDDVSDTNQSAIENCRPFECDESECTWTFPTMAKLERHKNSHSKEKAFKCDFEGCSKAFTTKSNLRHHENSVHKTVGKYACVIEGCDSLFRLQNELDAHVAKHDGVRPSHRCEEPQCGKEFVTKNALSSHARRHRHQTNELQCNICEKTFEAPCRLRVHMQAHSGHKPFPCTQPGCDWTFPTPSKLVRHMDKHLQRRRYTCTTPDCGKMFLRIEHLRDHQQTHSRPKPLRSTSSELNNSQSPTRRSLRSRQHQSPGDTCSDIKSVPGTTAARTSLTYCDIVFEKRDRFAEAEASGIVALPFVQDVSSPSSTTAVTEEPSVTVIQEDLLNQDYLQTLLDSSSRFSDFEPSTVNLRDLE